MSEADWLAEKRAEVLRLHPAPVPLCLDCGECLSQHWEFPGRCDHFRMPPRCVYGLALSESVRP